MNFQFHTLARIDDTCNVPKEKKTALPNFNFALKTRLNWAKNCYKERNAPWQVVLGSLDSSFCVLISLALWLIMFFSCSSTCKSHLMLLVSLPIVEFQKEEHQANK